MHTTTFAPHTHSQQVIAHSWKTSHSIYMYTHTQQGLLAEVRARGASVPEVSWAVAGETAGLAALMGTPDSFLSDARLKLYGTKRNDPTIPQV